jgi:hypothetical protein
MRYSSCGGQVYLRKEQNESRCFPHHGKNQDVGDLLITQDLEGVQNILQ